MTAETLGRGIGDDFEGAFCGEIGVHFDGVGVAFINILGRADEFAGDAHVLASADGFKNAASGRDYKRD
jgi:hypothetical protein